MPPTPLQALRTNLVDIQRRLERSEAEQQAEQQRLRAQAYVEGVFVQAEDEWRQWQAREGRAAQRRVRAQEISRNTRQKRRLQLKAELLQTRGCMQEATRERYRLGYQERMARLTARSRAARSAAATAAATTIAAVPALSPQGSGGGVVDKRDAVQQRRSRVEEEQMMAERRALVRGVLDEAIGAAMGRIIVPPALHVGRSVARDIISGSVAFAARSRRPRPLQLLGYDRRSQRRPIAVSETVRPAQLTTQQRPAQPTNACGVWGRWLGSAARRPATRTAGAGRGRWGCTGRPSGRWRRRLLPRLLLLLIPPLISLSAALRPCRRRGREAPPAVASACGGRRRCCAACGSVRTRRSARRGARRALRRPRGLAWLGLAARLTGAPPCVAGAWRRGRARGSGGRLVWHDFSARRRRRRRSGRRAQIEPRSGTAVLIAAAGGAGSRSRSWCPGGRWAAAAAAVVASSSSWRRMGRGSGDTGGSRWRWRHGAVF
eukprot:COSAG01_NODE_311_length_19072_cov_73.511727_4_plen_490_part_00